MNIGPVVDAFNNTAQSLLSSFFDNPSAQSYTVQQGDLLSDIAAANGTTVDAIVALNSGTINNPDVIYPGDILKIPTSNVDSNTSSASEISNSAASTTATTTATTTANPTSSNTNSVAAGQNPLSTLLQRGESGSAGYNAYNRGRDGNDSQPQNLTDLTVGEVMRRQDPNYHGSDSLFAVGKYQIIPGTMKATVEKLGIDPGEKFSPQMQERMFSDYLITFKQPSIREYITGQSNDLHKAQYELASEWASVADPDTGKSAYDGVGGNSSSITADESAKALNQMRDMYKANIAQGMSPSQAWSALNGSSGSTGSPGATTNIAQPDAIKNGGFLNKGDTGEGVKNLQRLLIANGANIKVTGTFDNATAREVERRCPRFCVY